MFTGAWFMTTGLGLILGFVAKLITGWVAARNSADAAYERGASDVAAQINRETADADRRAAQAQADAPGGRNLDDLLSAGTIRF